VRANVVPHPLDVSIVVGPDPGGVTGRTGAAQTFRAAPSGAALYPLELYAACRRVDGAAAAIYHYDPLRHCLEHLRTLEASADTGGPTPYEELVEGSGVVLVLTAVFWRSRFK
jgi:SagB-type dehydrogenase family enzyme